jgi:hypothetical protein
MTPAFLGLSVDRIRGLLSATAGDADAAAGHFEKALAFCRRAGYLPEVAWTAAELAETLRARSRAGDGERAEQLTEEAREVAARLQMRGLALRRA